MPRGNLKVQRRSLISASREYPRISIVLEMLVIVVSILLAFGIEAWWADGQERKAVAEYQDLLAVQMSVNYSMLQSEVETAERSQAALLAAIRAISPRPSPIPADSLWGLMRACWSMSDRNLEIAALESVLGLESFDPAADPALYRQLIAFMGQADRLGDNVDRFVVAKERTSDYIRTVSPLPALMFADPDSGQAFPVPIDDLLQDPQLESLLKELHDRQRLRGQWALQLMSLADSISTALVNGM